MKAEDIEVGDTVEFDGQGRMEAVRVVPRLYSREELVRLWEWYHSAPVVRIPTGDIRSILKRDMSDE